MGFSWKLSRHLVPGFLLCRGGERHDERADQHEDPTRRNQGGEGDCQERRRPLLLYVQVLMSHMCGTGKAKRAFIPSRTIYIAENLGTAPHIHVKYLRFFSADYPMIRKTTDTCYTRVWPSVRTSSNLFRESTTAGRALFIVLFFCWLLIYTYKVELFSLVFR